MTESEADAYIVAWNRHDSDSIVAQLTDSGTPRYHHGTGWTCRAGLSVRAATRTPDVTEHECRLVLA